MTPSRSSLLLLAGACALAPLTASATAGGLAIARDFARADLENGRIKATVTVDRGVLRGVRLTDKTTGRILDLGEPFTLNLLVIPDDDTADDAKPSLPVTLKASDFVAGQPVVADIPAIPDARRLIDRVGGKSITVRLAPRPDGLSAVWKIELRADAGYIRQTLTLVPLQAEAEIKEIRLLDFAADDAHVAGTVKGSPVVVGPNIFAGVEHPMADNVVKDGRVTGSLFRRVPVGGRREFSLSSVVGVTAPGQLRREFQLGYVNRERARPYAPYLNYNTWYDIGYFTRYDEKMATDVVKTYGEELVKKRGVKFDSFLFDDGWDDTATLWQFIGKFKDGKGVSHDGFPNEFKDLSKLAESYGASPGVWFSPWGGYGAPKEQRIKAAHEKNPKVEINKSGFALSGPNYYKVFRDMCLRMIRDNGIRHFKFDGTGDAGSVQPGSKFGSDFEAIIALIAELRHEQPDLYVNLTTGTWASPFWFGTADSIWRGGYDHEFLGVGSKRNQWITYRDGMTYRYNVASAPLFPINSLMLHGVLYAKGARDLGATGNDEKKIAETRKDAEDNLPAEIWSGFGGGSQMEELYITPSLLTQPQWDELAKAAKWAKANAGTLIDTHWIGGDPVKLQVYGWASWSPEKGILVLRNPSDAEQTFAADPAALFELPVGAPTRYTVTSPRGESPVASLEAGRPLTLKLKPFEVLVLEATPAK